MKKNEVSTEKKDSMLSGLTGKYKKKLIVGGIVVFIVLAAILGIFLKGYFSANEKYKQIIKEQEEEISRLEKALEDRIGPYINTDTEVGVGIIEAKIQSIGELASMEYYYTDANKFSNSRKVFDIELPGTKKSFIAKWNGSIKAGVNIENVTCEVNEEKREIVITMPKAEILSHEVDEHSYELLDEKNNVFNPISAKDSNKLESASKQLMEERAVENGLLEKASENAQNIITTFINVGAVQEQGYKIIFKEG